MSKAKIFAITNQKGGPGKSTVAFNLAHAAAEFGMRGKPARVLCLDHDSQGNLSQYLTGDLDVIKDTDGGMGLLFEGKPVTPTKTSNPYIDILHGHEKLDRYDNDDAVHERCFDPAFREMLQQLDYDVIIIDTPPAVGFRQLGALLWADVVVIPAEPVASSISGLQNVLRTIETIIDPMNPGVKWVTVINRANLRVRSHLEKEKFLRERYGKRVLATLTARTGVSDAMEDEPARPVWKHRGAPKELREQWRAFCKNVLSCK